MNFRKLSVPLAALIAAGTLSAFSGTLSTNAAIAPDDYLIRNQATGRYLTAANEDINIGTPIIEYSADGISSANRWIKQTDENGITRFVSEMNQGNLALGISSEGKLTIVQRDDSDIFQQFTLEETEHGTKITAGGWALTPETSETDGAQISMQAENEASLWEFIPVYHNASIPGDINKDGIVNIYDLILSKQLLLGQRPGEIEQRMIADVDGASGFTVSDIVKLTKYLHGADTMQYAAGYRSFPRNTITPKSDLIPDIPQTEPDTEPETETATEAEELKQITLADMPENYKEPMEWIWQNRFVREGSTTRWNTIFDQIVAGKGTLNFVVRWQSYKTVTYEQRQQFEKMASDCINAWNDYLKGYDGWKYDHIDVKVVGWAVLDKSCLLDLHDDEVVWDNLIEPYDSQYDTSNGYETIPDKLPSAPSELSRFDHFTDKNYQYPGTRFDMYLWCTQGFPAIGGAGGDWGQRMSDDAYLGMLSGQNLHVLEHEIGHGFGITDFYGGEGEQDGYPVGGFPGNGTSIMMAGSSTEITDFDGWMLRYIWSNIKDEAGRF